MNLDQTADMIETVCQQNALQVTVTGGVRTPRWTSFDVTGARLADLLRIERMIEDALKRAILIRESRRGLMIEVQR